jgi:hypothetical protein
MPASSSNATISALESQHASDSWGQFLPAAESKTALSYPRFMAIQGIERWRQSTALYRLRRPSAKLGNSHRKSHRAFRD